MIAKGLFKRHKNELEGSTKTSDSTARIPQEICVICAKFKATLFREDVLKNLCVCPKCGHHFKINARLRLNFLVDSGTFIEHDKEMQPKNLLNFPDYENKLQASASKSAEKEAVVCGVGKIGGMKVAIFVMEPNFMMGSMGTVVGEKITRLFEYATENSLPVLGCTVSGGARMQEGVLSLMQMAKVSGALKRHSDQGNLYITLITDPTTGGVTASFAMLGDIIISEPNALICFAGPRVIEQTIRQKLPEGFQHAEFVFETGFIDNIVARKDQKEYISKLLRLHKA